MAWFCMIQVWTDYPHLAIENRSYWACKRSQVVHLNAQPGNVKCTKKASKLMAQAENSPFPKPWVPHNAPKSDLITQTKVWRKLYSISLLLPKRAACHVSRENTSNCFDEWHTIFVLIIHLSHLSLLLHRMPHAATKVIFNILARSYRQDIGTGRHNTFAF